MNKIKYKGKIYKIHIGKRGGKYIVKNKKKTYIQGGTLFSMQSCLTGGVKKPKQNNEISNQNNEISNQNNEISNQNNEISNQNNEKITLGIEWDASGMFVSGLRNDDEKNISPIKTNMPFQDKVVIATVNYNGNEKIKLSIESHGIREIDPTPTMERYKNEEKWQISQNCLYGNRNLFAQQFIFSVAYYHTRIFILEILKSFKIAFVPNFEELKKKLLIYFRTTKNTTKRTTKHLKKFLDEAKKILDKVIIESTEKQKALYNRFYKNMKELIKLLHNLKQKYHLIMKSSKISKLSEKYKVFNLEVILGVFKNSKELVDNLNATEKLITDINKMIDEDYWTEYSYWPHNLTGYMCNTGFELEYLERSILKRGKPQLTLGMSFKRLWKYIESVIIIQKKMETPDKLLENIYIPVLHDIILPIQKMKIDIPQSRLGEVLSYINFIAFIAINMTYWWKSKLGYIPYIKILFPFLPRTPLSLFYDEIFEEDQEFIQDIIETMIIPMVLKFMKIKGKDDKNSHCDGRYVWKFISKDKNKIGKRFDIIGWLCSITDNSEYFNQNHRTNETNDIDYQRLTLYRTTNDPLLRTKKDPAVITSDDLEYLEEDYKEIFEGQIFYPITVDNLTGWGGFGFMGGALASDGNSMYNRDGNNFICEHRRFNSALGANFIQYIDIFGDNISIGQDSNYESYISKKHKQIVAIYFGYMKRFKKQKKPFQNFKIISKLLLFNKGLYAYMEKYKEKYKEKNEVIDEKVYNNYEQEIINQEKNKHSLHHFDTKKIKLDEKDFKKIMKILDNLSLTEYLSILPSNKAGLLWNDFRQALNGYISHHIPEWDNGDIFGGDIIDFKETDYKITNIVYGGKKRKVKNVRKHRGIHQNGGKIGKLKKGYKYSGKKLKNCKAEIIKCKTK